MNHLRPAIVPSPTSAQTLLRLGYAPGFPLAKNIDRGVAATTSNLFATSIYKPVSMRGVAEDTVVQGNAELVPAPGIRALETSTPGIRSEAVYAHAPWLAELRIRPPFIETGVWLRWATPRRAFRAQASTPQ